MPTLENQLPPLAQALGRLRHPRPWPYSPRAQDTTTGGTSGSAPDASPHPQPPPPAHDFLRIVPEPALTGELPTSKTRLLEEFAAEPEPARIYWFDR